MWLLRPLTHLSAKFIGGRLLEYTLANEFCRYACHDVVLEVVVIVIVDSEVLGVAKSSLLCEGNGVSLCL